MFFNLVGLILAIYLVTKIIQRLFRKSNKADKADLLREKIRVFKKKEKYAESLCAETNKLVKAANKSENYEFRIKNIQLAYIKLAELKAIATEDSKFQLDELDKFLGFIKTVEKETDNLISKNSISIKRTTIAQLDEPYLSMATNLFRIINESIALVINSKNLETKTARLDTAKLRLNELKKLSNDLGVDITGIAEASSEIERLEYAIENNLPTISSELRIIDSDDIYNSDARKLLKEATALKKEKKFELACQKLREAYKADGAEQLMIEERLRLPMYLQLAGKNQEGWKELIRLSQLHAEDGYLTSSIEKQKRIFIKKQKNSESTAISIGKFELNKNLRLDGYCWFNTTSDTEIDSNEYWKSFSANVEQGQFWAHEIQKSQNLPYERLKLALFNLPLPAAFRESAIALRYLIRDKRAKKESFDAELRFLYWLAAVDSFVLPSCKTYPMPGFNVIESIPALTLKKIEFTYNDLGFEKLELLNKTDCKLISEAWGLPSKHSTLNELHSNLWNIYEAKAVQKHIKNIEY